MTEVLKSFDESNENKIEEKPVAEEVAEVKEVEEAPEVKAEEVVEAKEEETTEAVEEPKEEAEDDKEEEGKEDDEGAEAPKAEEEPKEGTEEEPKEELEAEPKEEVEKSAELADDKQNLGQTLEAILTVVKSLGSTLEKNSKDTTELSERIAKLEETAKAVETKPVEEPKDEPAEVKEVEEVKPEAPEEEPKEETKVDVTVEPDAIKGLIEKRDSIEEAIIIPDEEATSKSVKVAPEKVEEVESISKSADGEAEVDAYVSKSADVTENLVEKSEEEEPEKEPELSDEEVAKAYAIDNREAVLDKLKAVSRNRQVSSSDVSIYRNAYLRAIDGNGSKIDLQNLKELITLK